MLSLVFHEVELGAESVSKELQGEHLLPINDHDELAAFLCVLPGGYSQTAIGASKSIGMQLEKKHNL